MGCEIPRENLIERTARKRHSCAGNGAKAERLAHAEGCNGEILPGEPYIECLESAPAYRSGSRHSALCAAEFLGVMVEGDLSGGGRS